METAMSDKARSRKTIPSNPPRYPYVKCSVPLYERKQDVIYRGKTTFFTAEGLNWQETKMPVNHSLPLTSYQPENPEIQQKQSLKKYLEEYNEEENWMPRFVPHNLMHWWEAHFYNVLKREESLANSGFTDLVVILSAKPESTRINKFILNYVGRRVNEYLNHIVVKEEIQHEHQYRFLEFSGFIFCFLTMLLEVSKKLGHEENTQMLEKLVQRALKKVELKLRDVIDNYTDIEAFNMYNAMNSAKCSFFATVIPKFEEQTEEEIQKMQYQGYNSEDAKVALSFWKKIGAAEIANNAEKEFNKFTNKVLLDRWLEEQKEREREMKAQGKRERNLSINHLPLTPAMIDKLKLDVIKEKISFDQILDRDFGIWARESSDQRRISFLTYKYLDKN